MSLTQGDMWRKYQYGETEGQRKGETVRLPSLGDKVWLVKRLELLLVATTDAVGSRFSANARCVYCHAHLPQVLKAAQMRN